MSKPVCDLCQDTHVMPATGYMCTHCPTPCQQCRSGGYGAFCEHTPCSCACHSEQHKELMRWYADPLTKEHIAQLRYKLAQARGLLLAYRVNLPPTEQELQAIIDETQDP